jgi:hypothetical protein
MLRTVGRAVAEFRIQIRDMSGHLRQGPEVPVDQIGAVVSAVIDLLKERAR